MRKALVLVVWLVGIMFPAAWLGQFSTVYRGAFNRVFGPEWTHVFMHMLIYGVLCILLLATIWQASGLAPVFQNRPDERAGGIDHRLAFKLTGVVLAVGTIQESLQWISQGVVPWQGVALSASLFDLGIDLTGGLLGAGMVLVWRVYRQS